MNYNQNVNNIAKQLGLEHNVSIRVVDKATGQCVQEHTGHNSATNTLLTGIAHYLIGDGVLNQGSYMLSEYVPKYISLGTMGLYNQDSDADGLPTGIGVSAISDEVVNFTAYMNQCPGYGADGYDENINNNRPYFGLGPTFDDRPNINMAVNCELISKRFPRSQISFRDIVPEDQSELPRTIDVVFSAMISTGGLKDFRCGRDYIYITEAGLWADPVWSSTEENGANGLLAAYRIIPPNESNWDMTVDENRQILKENIIRVGLNQVVQIIWKVQLGSVNEFGDTIRTEPIIWRVT